MELKQINQEWCEAFTDSLTGQKAAIVFSLGITAQGGIRNCVSTDVTKEQLKAALIETLSCIDSMPWPVNEVTEHPFLKSVIVK